ncbi:hypothetical protein ACSRCY_23175, partial [Salmonella enterica]
LEETETAHNDEIALSEEHTQPEGEPVTETADTETVVTDEAWQESEISPAARLAQLTAGLDALHHTQLLVSPHVDKKQIAAVIAEWT